MMMMMTTTMMAMTMIKNNNANKISGCIREAWAHSLLGTTGCVLKWGF